VECKEVPVKLLAIDGNNLLMRAVFATKRANLTAHGVPTGPLLVFVNTLSRHIREEHPTHIGIAWDSPGQGLRGSIDENYKANRVPAPDDEHELKESAFALAKEFCALAGVFQHSYLDAGVEADDILADWWRYWIADGANQTSEMVILSSDKDLLQLVDCPRITQIRLSSADTPTDRWNAARVTEHYGVPPRSVPAVLAVAGDTSDNIIGIRGIGPKKAAKALGEHGLDFEQTIMARWPDDVERLRANYRLTDLRTAWQYEGLPRPTPPPAARLTGPQGALWEGLLAFLDRYELRTVRERLVAGQLWSGSPPQRKVGRPLPVR
jgi:5'-3' exonuclease